MNLRFRAMERQEPTTSIIKVGMQRPTDSLPGRRFALQHLDDTLPAVYEEPLAIPTEVQLLHLRMQEGRRAMVRQTEASTQHSYNCRHRYRHPSASLVDTDPCEHLVYSGAPVRVESPR